jgi:hemolysin activation/secretion protein
MQAGRPLLFATALLALAWSALTLAQAPVAPRFEIQRFVVEGNTLLPQPRIDSIVAPYTGTGRDFGDVQRALEALQEAYLARGFTAVRVLVPEQDIKAGTVRLQVIEARIESIRVENNQHFSEANVRASLPSLKPGSSPNTHAISKNVQLVNENPAKQVGVALESSETAGMVKAAVRVADEDPVRYSAFVDSTGTSQTGNYRTGIGYQNANVAGRDHVFNAQAITSPSHTKDVAIYGLGYRAPVYRWDGTFDALAGHSNVNSGTVQDLFTVAGAGTIFGLHYTQILPRIESYEQKLALGWDYRAFHNNVALVGTSGSGSLIPDITVRPLSLAYNGKKSQLGRDVAFYVSYSRNLSGGKNGDQDAFTAQRDGAAANYSIARAGAVLSQSLPQDYLVRVTFNAQQTRNLLIASEQFGMGGADSVRGFYERETANDIGRRLSLEGYTPDFGARIGSTWRVRALAFVDRARGRDNVPEHSLENRPGSVGLGLRMNAGKSLSARFDWARVTSAAGSRQVGDSKLHFVIAYSF